MKPSQLFDTVNHHKRRLVGKMLSYEQVNALIYKCGGYKALVNIYLHTLDASGAVAGKASVLCLERMHFSRDIKALRHSATHYNWISVPEDKLGRIQMPWVPEKRRGQTTHKFQDRAGTIDEFDISAEMAAYILQKISKRFPVKAVMSSHLDYWQAEGFRRACKTHSVPFTVLLREVETIPATAEALVDEYVPLSYQYPGAAIGVFNERTKNVLLDTKCCLENQVYITGAPRLDSWLETLSQKNLSLDKRKTITLLSYFHPLYFAQKNFFEVCSILNDLASKHRDKVLDFKLKCKGKPDREAIQKAFEEQDNPLNNLNLTVETDLQPVFDISRVVIGFNSLALVEATFSDAIVIIPQWGDAAGNPELQNIQKDDPLAQKIYYFARSPEELRQWLELAIQNELPPRPATLEDKISFMNYFFHIVPGETASGRVQDMIDHYVRGNSEAS